MMASPEEPNSPQNDLKENTQFSEANIEKIMRSELVEVDTKEKGRQPMPPTNEIESLPRRISPQEEVSNPDRNPKARRLMKNIREEASNTAGKGDNLSPSPGFLGAEEDRREEASNPIVTRKTPPSSSDPDPDPNPSRWRYLQVLFDRYRRGNGCNVNEECLDVFNYVEMHDCPDVNRKAGTWGCECLSFNDLHPSQYWYMSICVLPRAGDTAFPGTLCEVGVGTEYALHVLQSVSPEARTRYIKSTFSLNHAEIQRLALADSTYDDLVASRERQALVVDLGFYWNIPQRRLHILHLKKNGFSLLHSGNVSETMYVWPVVSVAPYSECNTRVEIWALNPEECPYAPNIDQENLKAIVNAPSL